MKLYTTNRSPYSRKIYVMAIEKGVDKQITKEIIDLSNKPKDFLKHNPMGLVPTLILDNNKALFDSAVIAEYIDSLTKENRMIPKRGKKRFYVLKISALADAMVEQAIALYYETLKDEAARDKEKVKKTTDNLSRAFKMLNKETKRFSKELSMAPIAVGAALGYIDFRLKDLGWRDKNDNLAQWFKEFSERPSMKATIPTM